VKSLMHFLGRVLGPDQTGENRRAVEILGRIIRLRDALSLERLRRGRATWPVTRGDYLVGDPSAPVAVCTLTSTGLAAPLAALPGVAIAGKVYTPNLGIEKIIANITSNPNIRFLLVCGKESPVFWVGQALANLFSKGIDAEHRIIGARGHYPVLVNLSADRVESFRQQVELVDCTGELEQQVIEARVHELALRSPGPFLPVGTDGIETLIPPEPDPEADSQFKPLRPGGHRQPLVYDPNGFYIIQVDHVRREIVVRHYLNDHTPAHIMRGRFAEPILLGLIREGLVTQLSHAGYLGVELTKAETALKLGKKYEQDKPVGRILSEESR
jgi:tetrahydromethanopterin S-methyltransferase subunit A